MQVNSISPQSFSGSIKQTKNGNYYEKSNDGKTYIPLVYLTTAGISAAIAFKNKSFTKEFVSKVQSFKKIQKMPLEELKPYGITKEIQDLFKSISIDSAKKAVKTGMVASRIAKVGLSALVVGTITDAIINVQRRKDADKFARTKEVDSKTNEGIKTGAFVGGTLSAFAVATELIMMKKLNNFKTLKLSEKLSKFTAVPVAIAVWAFLGSVYDHGVNKFRGKLAKKAEVEKAKEIENDKKLDAKINTKVISVLNQLFAS